jgi:hypothetical protein
VIELVDVNTLTVVARFFLLNVKLIDRLVFFEQTSAEICAKADRSRDIFGSLCGCKVPDDS